MDFIHTQSVTLFPQWSAGSHSISGSLTAIKSKVNEALTPDYWMFPSYLIRILHLYNTFIHIFCQVSFKFVLAPWLFQMRLEVTWLVTSQKGGILVCDYRGCKSALSTVNWIRSGNIVVYSLVRWRGMFLITCWLLYTFPRLYRGAKNVIHFVFKL